ncbi:putative vomeronasal receptor-like protein 4 [Ctenodactylus gundi]
MILKHVKGTIFVFLFVAGIMGNMFVFVKYMLMFGGTEKKSIHLILIHLVFTNIIMLISKGVPNIIAAFGFRKFLDDIGCKIVVYLERVARGLTICTSSLLTVVQAITISPRHSGWRRLKPNSVSHILLLFLFFWILSSFISMLLLFSITSTSMNISQMSESNNYCYFLPESENIKWILLIFMILRDAMFQSVMGGASGYMVFLLHKHHQQVLHLQNSKLFYKTPPEVKPAQSILLLMLCFLFFYWIVYIRPLYLIFKECLLACTGTSELPDVGVSPQPAPT